jgi:hypothetical protein
MAISATHYHLLKELRDAGVLPHRGRILEIGKANWYGDMSYTDMLIDLGELPADRPPPLSLDMSLGGDRQGYLFGVVSQLYKLLMQPVSVVSFDMDPTAVALDAKPWDLNTFAILSEDGRGNFNLVINHGTAEHIFNIANVFRVMHDACAVGGLMIHESPFTGWVDHGFYCLQPTLFWDVAAANGYEIVKVAIEHLASRSIVPIQSREQILEMKRRDQLPDNAMLWVAMRKTSAEAFKVPMQGVYSNSVSAEVQQAWRELR